MKTRYILNPVFLFSLLVLVMNDAFFKWQFHNGLTGKLSDVFGLIVFVQFFNVFIPEQKRIHVYISAALLFILWKSSLSQPVIDAWNGLHLFTLNRVVDYTDVLCVLVLIPLYYYQPSAHPLKFKKEFVTVPLMAVTIFSMVATSYYYSRDYNTMYIGETVKLKTSPLEFLKQLEKEGINYTQDSVYVFGGDTFQRYILQHINLPSPQLSPVHRAYIGVHNKGKKIEVFVDRMEISGDSGAYTINTVNDTALLRQYRAMQRTYYEETERYIKGWKEKFKQEEE